VPVALTAALRQAQQYVAPSENASEAVEVIRTSDFGRIELHPHATGLNDGFHYLYSHVDSDCRQLCDLQFSYVAAITMARTAFALLIGFGGPFARGSSSVQFWMCVAYPIVASFNRVFYFTAMPKELLYFMTVYAYAFPAMIFRMTMLYEATLNSVFTLFIIELVFKLLVYIVTDIAKLREWRYDMLASTSRKRNRPVFPPQDAETALLLTDIRFLVIQCMDGTMALAGLLLASFGPALVATSINPIAASSSQYGHSYVTFLSFSAAAHAHLIFQIVTLTKDLNHSHDISGCGCILAWA
jgi:hypothetical protein